MNILTSILWPTQQLEASSCHALYDLAPFCMCKSEKTKINAPKFKKKMLTSRIQLIGQIYDICNRIQV